MNVTASPRPTTARAAMASGSDSVNAEGELAGGHQRRARHDQHSRAEPVEQQPGGHLRACVDDDLQDDERGQHGWGRR